MDPISEKMKQFNDHSFQGGTFLATPNGVWLNHEPGAKLYAMSIGQRILITALLAASTYSPAQSCLKGLPESLRSAVEQHGWTIVEPQDLPQTDLDIWNNTHLGECPGVAVGNPSPKAKPYFIVALIQPDGPKNFIEKVLLVTARQNQQTTNKPVIQVAVAETTVSTPHVVWLQKDHYLGIDPPASRDSFVFEKLTGPASQPIVQGSHIKSFIASN